MGLSVNEQPTEELHKSVVPKFKWRKVNARFKDNIWAADLAEMKSLSSENEIIMLQMFSLKVHELNLWKINKAKQFLTYLLK